MRENIGLYRAKPKHKGDYYFFSLNWKDSCKDGFVYGSLVVAHDRYYICVSALCNINCCVNNGVTSMIEVIPETVGRYTGLTDKNGKKIFENDIVKREFTLYHNEKKRTRETQVGVVTYSDTDCGFYLEKACNLRKPWDGDTLEVIGNIHDNPELLKGGGDNGIQH